MDGWHFCHKTIHKNDLNGIKNRKKISFYVLPFLSSLLILSMSEAGWIDGKSRSAEKKALGNSSFYVLRLHSDLNFQHHPYGCWIREIPFHPLRSAPVAIRSFSKWSILMDFVHTLLGARGELCRWVQMDENFESWRMSEKLTILHSPSI